MADSPVTIEVVLVPALLPLTGLEGTVTAVIDVLRATTSVITAIANGAARVIPCLEAAEARRLAREEPGCLLGGEEMGRRIHDFELGNSPLEYTAGVIRGKTIFFATSNGTPTLRAANAGSGGPVHLAALVNASAVAGKLAAGVLDCPSGKAVIVCSGSHGRVAAEDVFCAGVVVNRITWLLSQKPAPFNFTLTDEAKVAAAFAAGKEEKALEVLREGEHGRYLEQIGFGEDIRFAAGIDRFKLTPVFDGSHIMAEASG